ncbi:MAG TPA: zinc ribbon domain-containing protein [Solirubrobacterales bacterium]|jgi:hypothetical protein
MPLAIFGIENDGLNLAINLLLLFVVVVWLSLVAYTFLDARRRLDDFFLVACATLASLIFPFLGTIVYSILRPPEFLEDARERELEIKAAELRLRHLEESSCPNCQFPIERTYLRCPSCRARIKDPCESCGKPIDPRWAICPYCETPTRRAAAPRRRAVPRGKEGAAPARPVAPEARPTRAKRPAARTAAGKQASSQEAARSAKRPASARSQSQPRRSSRSSGDASAS